MTSARRRTVAVVALLLGTAALTIGIRAAPLQAATTTTVAPTTAPTTAPTAATTAPGPAAAPSGAATAPASPDSVRLEVLAQPPIARPGEPVGISVAVRGSAAAVAGLNVRARLGEPVADRDELHAAIGGDRFSTVGEPLRTTLTPAPDGAVATVDASIAESGRTGDDRVVLRRSGVYPLDVSVRRNDTTVASLITFLIRQSAAAPSAPLRLAVIQPVFVAPPPRPELDSDDEAFADAMAPSGPIGQLVRTPSPIPLTWAPVPDSLVRMATTRDALAQETWTLLRARLLADDLLGGTQARTVPTAWPALGAGETQAQFTRGAGTLAATLGRPVPPDVVLATGSPLPTAALAPAAASGAGCIVVDPSAVVDAPTDQPFRFAAGGVHGIIPDPRIAELLARPVGAVGAAQTALADAVVAADGLDGATRGVVVVFGGGTATTSDLVHEFGTRVAAATALRPVSVRTLLREVPEAVPPKRASGVALSTPDATPDRTAKSVYAALAGAHVEIARLAATVEGTSAALIAADNDVFRGADVGLAESGDGLTYAASASRFATTRLAGIQLPPPQAVQLTAREASLPVSVRNESGFTVRATLVARAPDVAFPKGSSFDITLPPRTVTVEVPIELASTGPYTIEFSLLTRPTGERLESSSTTVRSSAVNGVAVVLTIASLAVLALWWIRTALRRRRTGHHRRDGGRHVRPPFTPRPQMPTEHAVASAATIDLAPAPTPTEPDPHEVADDAPGVDGIPAGAASTPPRDREAERMSSADTTSGLMRSSAVMATGTLLSRVTGLAKLLVFVWFFGQGVVTDIYNTANNLPNQVYELLLGGILTSVLVPVIVDHLQRRDRERGWREVGNVFWAGLAFGVVGSVVLAVAAPWLVTLTMPKYAANPTTRDTAITLVWMFSAQIFFYALTAVSNAVLNARRNFVVTAFTPVLNNLAVIGVFVMLELLYGHLSSVPIDPAALALIGFGTTAGIALMGVVSVVMMWRVVRAGGATLPLRIDPRSEALRTIARLSVWTLLYVLTNQIGLVVVQHLANSPQAADGTISAWTAAFQFFQLPIGLIAVSLFTVLLPSISAKIAAGDIDAYRTQFTNAVRLVVFLTLPAMVLYVQLGQDILTVFMGYGRFSPADVARTSGALSGFALALVPYAVFLLVLRSFYAAKDTRTPMLVNVVATVVAIGLDLALFSVLHDVFALTLAFAASYVVAALLGWWALARRFGGLKTASTALACGRLFVAAIAMGLASGTVVRVTAMLGLRSDSSLVTGLADITLGSLVGIGVYLGVARLLGAHEWRQLTATLKRRRGGNDAGSGSTGPHPDDGGDDVVGRGDVVAAETPAR